MGTVCNMGQKSAPKNVHLKDILTVFALKTFSFAAFKMG